MEHVGRMLYVIHIYIIRLNRLSQADLVDYHHACVHCEAIEYHAEQIVVVKYKKEIKDNDVYDTIYTKENEETETILEET